MVEDLLSVESSPDPRDVAALSERLYEYNAAVTGHDDGLELALFVRGDDGEIRGGLYGWTWAGRLQIQYLSLHESLPGEGYGARLLAAAEETARQRGCSVAAVETFTFQAPDFYRAHGYEVYDTHDGFPAGHQHLFLKKSLLDRSAGSETAREVATPA